MYETYVADRNQIGVKEKFRQAKNLLAYQAIVDKMLVAINKGYWQADPKVKALIEQYPDLPLLYNFGAVLIGLFYGYLPFMVLPLYSTLEKTNWTLLEAAADLGANGFRRFTRVLLPLSLPGIIAGCVQPFRISTFSGGASKVSS